MRKKLTIAKQLRISRKNYSSNPEHKKICSKCYRAYVKECVIKGKENFKISFGGKYIQSFPERICDWYEYVYIEIINIIYRLLRIEETYLEGNFKPVHVKVAEQPDEKVLYDFLEKNGFKITEEHLYGTTTVYDVVRKN